MLNNLLVTALVLGGVLVHALGTARKLDRATPEREPILGMLLTVLWGDDARWRTLLTLSVVLVVGMSGSTDALLAMVGVQIVAEGPVMVLAYGVAGYSIDSLGGNLRALLSSKAELEQEPGSDGAS